MRVDSVLKHSAQAVAEGALIALLVVGLAAGTTFAAKGGGGGGGKPGGGGGTTGGGMNITVNTVVDANANGLPNWGDTIHFSFTTSNPTPTVSVTCTQNGGLVYGDSHPYYWPNLWDDVGNFILQSPAWSSGAADCTAVVKGTSNGKTVTLGSTTFHVDA
jgi:hypothetical protein